MFTRYTFSRTLERLQLNLKQNDEVRNKYIPLFFEARKCLNGSLDDLAVVLSEDWGEEIPKELITSARLIPYKKSSRRFYEETGLTPYPLGIILEPKNWKKIMKIIKHKNVAGLYHKQDLDTPKEYTDIASYMAGLGIIILNTYEAKYHYELLSHEVLHSLLAKHSENLPYLQKLNNYQEFDEHHLTDVFEAHFTNEICASLLTLKEDWRWRRRNWRKSYLKRYMNCIESVVKSPRKKRVQRYLYERVSNELYSAKELAETFHPSFLIPLFFGIGPTMSEINDARFGSCFDDIIRWNVMLQDTKIVEKTKEILKQKGYKVT